MQFQVPQFIEIEDKIVGPLTFKQFVYIAGGLGLAYILWRIFPIYIGAPLVAASAGLGAALAFAQYNGRPLILAVEHGFFYFFHSKLYLWNTERRIREKKPDATKLSTNLGSVYIPKLSESRLSELAWSLDIKERIAAGTATPDEHTDAFAEHPEIIAPVRIAHEALIK